MTPAGIRFIVGAPSKKFDWSVVDRHDIEAFVAAAGSGRISLLRNFFRFARHRRIVLIDPTRGLTRNTSRGFIGKTLPLDRQRVLFRRWTTDPTVHPHEALLGVLALLHAASAPSPSRCDRRCSGSASTC